MSGLHLTLVKVQLLITLLLIGLDLTLGLLRADWLPVLASKVADYCWPVFVGHRKLNTLVMMGCSQKVIVLLQFVKVLGRRGGIGAAFHCLIELWSLISEFWVVTSVASWSCLRIGPKKSTTSSAHTLWFHSRGIWHQSILLFAIWVSPKLLSLDHEVLVLGSTCYSWVFLFSASCLSPALRSLRNKLSFRRFVENLGLVVTLWSPSHGLDVSVRALVL